MMYYFKVWLFNFTHAFYMNPGFIFLIWQNIMLTICAWYLRKAWKKRAGDLWR